MVNDAERDGDCDQLRDVQHAGQYEGSLLLTERCKERWRVVYECLNAVSMMSILKISAADLH